MRLASRATGQHIAALSSVVPSPSLPPPLLADLRALPRAFWILFAGTFINRFGTFVWPFLTIYLTRRGYSLEVAGAAVACWGVGSLAGSTLGGWLADRFGRRVSLVGGALAAAVTYLLIYFARTLPAIMLSVLLAGLAGSSYHPASSALLADLIPEQRRLRAYSTLRLALNAGFAAGSAVAGFLAASSFFWLFAGDALTTAAFAIIAWTLLPEGLRSAEQQAPWSEALSDARGNRAFHVLFIGSICLGLIGTQWGTTWSQHVIRYVPVLHLLGWRLEGAQAYGLLLAWNGFMVITLELPLTGWFLRYEPRQVMAAGYLLQGLGFALNIVCHDFRSLLLAITIFTLGEMACSPVSSAYLAAISPQEMRGRYLGLLSLSWSISGILGPLAGTRLLGLHPALLWSGCGLLGVIAATSVILGGRIIAPSR